jgi:hypothetical protein
MTIRLCDSSRTILRSGSDMYVLRWSQAGRDRRTTLEMSIPNLMGKRLSPVNIPAV